LVFERSVGDDGRLVGRAGSVPQCDCGHLLSVEAGLAGGGHVELGAGVLQAASAASGSSGRVGICAFHGFTVVR
jgi:hypothetical protein